MHHRYCTTMYICGCVYISIYRKWRFFQATVWKRVEMMKSELSPAPYTQADSRSHWSSDWKCNTELPSRLGIIHN